MSERRKKILMFGYLPPPVFGPSVVYETLMRSDFARRFDVTFINLSVVGSIRELESFRVGKLFKLAKFLSLEFYYLLTRRFEICCYPISFNRNAFIKDSVLLGVARGFGVPLVLWSHGTGVRRFRDALPATLRARFERTVDSAAAVLVLADCMHTEFDGSLPPERVHTITLGIEQQPAGAAEPAARDGRTLLYLGALVKAKGIFDLLEAMPLVRERQPQARLMVAGEWFKLDEEATALQLIHARQLADAIQFTGPVQGESKWQLLRSADVFVFPPYSQSEAFGIVLLEAMQAGLPLVTTKGGARNEIVTDGVNGVLAEEQNPRDLADKILLLLADAGLRERMGRASRERFEQRYTHQHYGQRMIELFEQLSVDPAR